MPKVSKLKTRKEVQKESKGSAFVGSLKKELNTNKFLEGAILRPVLLLLATASFIVAMFFLLAGNLKWGGSLILFSFVMNLYAIYLSLIDEPSTYRSFNLSLKLIIFLSEVAAFNWVIINHIQ